MRVPPAARAAVASLAAAPTEPVVMAVTGGIGTGKSATLAAVRAALNAGGVAVTPRLPRPGEEPGQAVVVDDAHLLDDDTLHQLTELVLDRTCTVVVAAEPLTHRPALRALVIAVQRERPVLALSALTAADIADAAATILATEPSPELIRALTTVTGGLPLLITAALSEPGTDPVALTRRAEQALTERLRWCDDAVLDAVVVLSLSGSWARPTWLPRCGSRCPTRWRWWTGPGPAACWDRPSPTRSCIASTTARPTPSAPRATDNSKPPFSQRNSMPRHCRPSWRSSWPSTDCRMIVSRAR